VAIQSLFDQPRSIVAQGGSSDGAKKTIPDIWMVSVILKLAERANNFVTFFDRETLDSFVFHEPRTINVVLIGISLWFLRLPAKWPHKLSFPPSLALAILILHRGPPKREDTHLGAICLP
jgi:hypothetical protein